MSKKNTSSREYRERSQQGDGGDLTRVGVKCILNPHPGTDEMVKQPHPGAGNARYVCTTWSIESVRGQREDHSAN